MATKIDTIRQAIVAAIQGAVPTATVYLAAIPDQEEAFRLSLRRTGPCIVVSNPGSSTVGQRPISTRTQDPTVLEWSIIIVAEDYRTPTSSLTKTLGCEEVSEAIRDVMRTTRVLLTDLDEVYLKPTSRTTAAPANRSELGGPVMFLETWQTTEALL